MKVTIIYQDSPNSVDALRTVIFGEEVRYFVQCTKGVNYRWRGFSTMEDVLEFFSDEEMQAEDLLAYEFDSKFAFHTSQEFDMWINSLCDDMWSLTELCA